MDNPSQYGFLGPIVGIAGLLVGAAVAIGFGFTRTFDAWKPPGNVLPEPLSRVVTMLCAIGLFVAWIMAEPSNRGAYIRSAVLLAILAAVAFLVYVGLRVYCGRFRKPSVNAQNQPGSSRVVWGGFWLTRVAKEQVRNGATVEQVLAGNLYATTAVWPPLSLTAAAVVTALTLLVILTCGTAALSTASTAIQVALTNKPARQVFGTAEVPGLSQPAPPPSR